ncbi:unnamed protein product, partial [Sphacelaria rigidula]
GSASAGKAEGRRGWTAQSSGNGSGLGCWIRTAINGATTEGSSPSSSSYHGGIRASADVAPAVDSVNGGGGGGGDGSSDRAESSFARGTPAAANSQSENGAAGRLEEGRIAVMELASQVQTAFAELQRLREEETSSASASISLTGAPERTFSRFATTAMKSFASAAALLVNLGPRPRPRPPPPPPPSRWRVAGVEGHELLVALAPLLQEMVKKQKREIASAVRAAKTKSKTRLEFINARPFVAGSTNLKQPVHPTVTFDKVYDSKDRSAVVDAWVPPHERAIDPFGEEGFACTSCGGELWSGYMHCNGCETLQGKDVNVCLVCYSKGKLAFSKPEKGSVGLTNEGHFPCDPVKNKKQRQQRASACLNKVKTRPRCCGNLTCPECHMCVAGACDCHEEFQRRFRFDTQAELEGLVRSVSDALGRPSWMADCGKDPPVAGACPKTGAAAHARGRETVRKAKATGKDKAPAAGKNTLLMHSSGSYPDTKPKGVSPKTKGNGGVVGKAKVGRPGAKAGGVRRGRPAKGGKAKPGRKKGSVKDSA